LPPEDARKRAANASAQLCGGGDGDERKRKEEQREEEMKEEAGGGRRRGEREGRPAVLEKQKKRQEIERDLVEKLRRKHSGKELSLVGLENEAIATLLPDPYAPTSQRLIRFLLSEIEPGFASGVPVPALVIYSLLNHWEFLSHRRASQAEAKQNEVLYMIVSVMRQNVCQRSDTEIELIMYWLSNACTLLHLVSEKLKATERASRRKQSLSEGDVDSEKDDEGDEEDEAEELYSVVAPTTPEVSRRRSQPQESRNGGAKKGVVAFKRQLSELVTQLYALLLKRVYNDLGHKLRECILFKKGRPDHHMSSPHPTSPQRLVSSIQPIKEVLSKYLLGLAHNFIFLSLVQKFFAQVFYFINATLFNEILLVRELCTVDKAVEIKMDLAMLENWIVEDGGLWLENAEVQLEPLHEIITLLLMPKKLIVSSQDLRREVIPHLNRTQVRQVLAMYTPTDLEERISPSDIQKLEREMPQKNGDELLLETAETFPLSSKELHYLEPTDANNIPFPFEIKQKVHEIVEEDILKRMSMARKVLKQTKGEGAIQALIEASVVGEETDTQEKKEPNKAYNTTGTVLPTPTIEDPQKKITHFWASFFGSH